MKLSQVLVLTGVIVLVVFLTTFFKMYLGNQGTTAGSGQSKSGSVTVKGQLKIPVTFGPLNPLSPDRGMDHEWQVPGHCDFWFMNDQDSAVPMGLLQTSCKCVRFEACLCTDAQKQRMAAFSVAAQLGAGSAAATAQAGLGSAAVLGLADWLAAARIAETQETSRADLTWQSLEAVEKDPQAKEIQIPAGGCGWVRMHWTAEALGPVRLVAELWTMAPTSNTTPIRLEVPLNIVEPVKVDATRKKLELLNTGFHSKEISFLVWSTTRQHFSLEPESAEVQKESHPFINCGRPIPLNAAEIQLVESAQLEPVLSAYRVPVTVREDLEDGRQHDMGPFRRTFSLTSDAKSEPIELTISGMVQGDVALVTEDKLGGISMGAFRSQDGKKMTVGLESERLDLELQPDRVPSFMKIQLTEEKLAGVAKKSWRLIVEVLPNQVLGVFPRDDPAFRDSAIYLKTQGKPPRRIRIPVRGDASVQ